MILTHRITLAKKAVALLLLVMSAQLLTVPLARPDESQAESSGILPLPEYSGDFAKRAYLFGGFGDERTEWASKGFTFDIDYNQYFQAVTDGGVDTDSEYGGTINYEINVDFDRMGLIPGGLLQMRARSRYGNSVNGISGLLLRTSGTVGEVLREIQDYHQVHIQAATWTMTTSARIASLNFRVDVQDITPLHRRLVVELALAQACKLIETLVGSGAYLDKVRVQYDYAEGRQAYRRFFRAPVEYNAEGNGLDFPISLLEKPVSPNDAALHEVVRQQMSGLDLSQKQQDLAHEVRVIIRTLLPTGQCTVERVARYYACDKRTLQRYLREENDTTYQALLDEVRFDLAQNYPRDGSA